MSDLDAILARIEQGHGTADDAAAIREIVARLQSEIDHLARRIETVEHEPVRRRFEPAAASGVYIAPQQEAEIRRLQAVGDTQAAQELIFKILADWAEHAQRSVRTKRRS